MDCSICLNEITQSTGRTVLVCGHNFHIACFMRNVLAAATTCPNCRNTLSEHECILVPHRHPHIPTLNLTDIQDDLFLAPEQPAILIGIPGVTTREQLESYYSAEICDYIYEWMRQTGVTHYAAYSKVFTSLLTVQAVMRGCLVRRRLRTNSA